MAGGSKSEMGNVGNHYMESHVLVYVQGNVGTPLVFELARNHHMKEAAGARAGGVWPGRRGRRHLRGQQRRPRRVLIARAVRKAVQQADGPGSASAAVKVPPMRVPAALPGVQIGLRGFFSA